MVGIKQSAWLTNVVVKVVVCLFVVVAGAFFIKSANLSPFVPPAGKAESQSGLGQPVIQALFGAPSSFGLAGVISAAAVVFFAYTGFEAVANLSEETNTPERDMPRGLIGTLVIATILYIGVSFVLTGMQKYTEINAGSPLASAFDSVGASWAGTLVSIAAVCGLTSVILVQLVGLGRIGFAMGRDRLLPPVVAKVDERTGTPARFTIGCAVEIMIIGGLVPLTDLADLVSIGALSAFALVSVAVPLLRHTRPELQRPFRVPFSPVLPIISALACVYLSLNLSLETWIRFVVWLAIGIAVYFGYGRGHARIRVRIPVRREDATVEAMTTPTNRPVRIGLQIQPQHADYTAIRRTVVEAEDLGVDILFNWDHFYPLYGDPEGQHFECWTMLGAWAEQTTRVEIGALVTCNSYRNPELLADMARTVDHMSDGRLIFGIGSGWFQRDYDEYGYEFGTAGGRLNQLRDDLPRIEARWAKLNPAPTRKIPVLVGGGGEKKTLKLVAQHADIWHSFSDLDTFNRKQQILAGHCADVGRDPGEIERSVAAPDADPAEAGPALLEAGATLFTVGIDGPDYDLTTLRRWLDWRDSL